ncbi:MAG: YceK/YidQ family lipoprotein [Desulfuromonadales bacterium]|nr:YceK/YidQ family lipoprotein [Desulfuromonadales bacterium]
MQKRVTKITMQLLFLILLLFSLFGCGTILAREHGSMYPGELYPATRFDAESIHSDFEPCSFICIAPFGTIFGVLDMPFSVVSDTLLLPYDIYKEHKKP